MTPLKAITFSLIFCAVYLCNAQNERSTSMAEDSRKHAVNLHWEIPVQFGLQYEYAFNQKFSGYFQAGLLREPNSTIILNTVESLGTDQSIVNLIESAFQSGVVLKEGINYHFHKYYAGFFLQQAFLTGDETPSDLVETLLNADFTTFPRRRGRTGTIERELTLNSNLFQLGFNFGRKFSLKNDFFLMAEFAMSFNVASNSTIESAQLDISSLNAELDDLLDDTYASYAHIPSLKFGIGKRF